MNKPTAHSKQIILATAVFVLTVSSSVFAQPDTGKCGNVSGKMTAEAKKDQPEIKDNLDSLDNSLAPLTRKDEEELTQMQKQARLYRAQGLEYQHLGNFQSAMSLYQKATQLDPAYAAAYNDLGVIYETRGFIDRAEQAYLQAIRIDPDFVSAYSNLALIYESQRDLDKAGMCWSKRAQLGDPNDPWAQKARQRLRDIRALSPKAAPKQQDLREQEIVKLVAEVSEYKKKVEKENQERIAKIKERVQTYMKKAIDMEIKGDAAAALRYATIAQKIDPENNLIRSYINNLLRRSNKALASSYMNDANLMEKRGDQVTAEKMAVDAQQLDPANEDINEYVDKLQIRNLSK